jgi:hypothetical protein
MIASARFVSTAADKKNSRDEDEEEDEEAAADACRAGI